MDQVAQDMAHALSLMQTALSLLDKVDPANVPAAHLDLAICRLSELMGRNDLERCFPAGTGKLFER